MGVLSLNHVSIRTKNLETCRAFYTDIIGLTDGERPPFPFPGAWLYCGDIPVVHLLGETSDTDNEGLEGYLGEREGDVAGSGSFDHVAFEVTGLKETIEKLKQKGVDYWERTVPLLGVHQVFIKDPEGITIELNFPETEIQPS